MHTVGLLDYQVKILDDDELAKTREIILAEIGRVQKSVRSVIFKNKAGKEFDGETFFEYAEAFEFEVQKLPLDQVMSMTASYVHNMDTLIEHVNDFFEFYFVEAKIFLYSLVSVEKFLVENRDKIEQNQPLTELKESVFQKYDYIEKFLIHSISLYDKFLESQDYEPLKAYRTYIMSQLGILYRRHAFFLSTSIDPAPVDKKEIMWIAELARRSMAVFEEMFTNNIFMDLDSAAIALANYANSLKLPMGDRERGLEAYKEAGNILGDIPEIMEGIEYFESLEIMK